MTIVFYISGHGFGHASRDIEVVHALARRQPDVRIVIRTAVPSSFFDVSARMPLEVQPLMPDTGVEQIDSVRIDEDATAREAATFYRDFDQRAAAEAHVLENLRADVVVGDVPPLAFAAAALAGLPSMLLANFTWDWIYEGYQGLVAAHGDVLQVMRGAYEAATRALRLPFHGGFDAVRHVLTDIPLIARKSQRDPAATRHRLGIDMDRPVVLASFSRYGIALPLDRVTADGRLTLLVADHEDGAGAATRTRSVVRITRRELTGLDLRYEDLVAAADVVVSKPGYGIVSECLANDTAFLYTPRARFVEQEVLLREMPDVLRCRPIAQADFSEGRWYDEVTALLDQPAPPRRLPIDGAEIAAQAILEQIRG